MEGKRSKLWHFFSKASEGKAKCDICLSSYSIKGGSTTNLKKHLMTKHRSSYVSLYATETDTSRTLLPSTSSSSTSQLNPVSISNSLGATCPEPVVETKQKNCKQSDLTLFTKKPMNIAREKKINDLILKMIVKDLQPFSVVEDSGFRDLMNYLEPNYKLPSRYVLSSGLLESHFTIVRETLKEELRRASYVSLTTDGWTSRATTSYQAVTAHYILSDVWELRSALLGCFECNERHTAEYIKQELSNIISDWEIGDKIVACVTDNAANMKAATRLIGWDHFACAAHTLNLIVRAGLDEIQSTIKKVKCIVEHFHKSSVATKKLISMQEQLNPGQKPLKLINDIVTRWNSTLDMLERIMKLQEPLEAAIGLLHNPIQSLSEGEWQALPEIVKILKPFKQLTEELSSEKDVTISKVLAGSNSVLRVLTSLCTTLTQDFSKHLLNKLISEFNHRFTNSSRHPLLSKSALLDPRFKRQAFFDDASYEYGKNMLKEELQTISVAQSVSEEQTAPNRSQVDEDSESIWAEFDKRTSCATTSTVAVTIITMRQYLEEKLCIRKDDPLKWWQARGLLYPQLADLVKKYLCVMATSVPSERIFSKSGQILSEKRSTIKPKRMEKILFLNANQRFLQ
nr:unnamed protein product [Callosobruchus chinensis]